MTAILQKSEQERYSDIFSALSEPLRLEIVHRMAADPEVACTALKTTLPISESTISYHIKVLAQAGLIDIRKDGRHYFYTLRSEVMEHYLPGFLGRIRDGALT